MHNVLTEENVKKLREELEYRLTVKRAEIAKEKMVAAAHGDTGQPGKEDSGDAVLPRQDAERDRGVSRHIPGAGIEA